jgi:DNA-binding MarR family transcriptional regulator/N-acetylglutamate synthase-like GNAT family acetyltransferase
VAIRKAHTDLIRGFYRFYTKRIGLLGEGLLNTPFSLAQARILYELGRNPGIRSTTLVEELDLDPGYLSRLLKGFESLGLIRRSSSRDDARASHLSLTAKGRVQFKRLDARSRGEIGQMLETLEGPQRERLVRSMTAIRELLGGSHKSDAVPSFTLRTHQPGDIGWLIARHGEIYARESQWDSSFEGLVAEIVGAFLKNFDHRRERCWIAERDGERVGCVFLVQHSKTVAKLRLLMVDASARGLGIGGRLVSECIDLARQIGYRKLTLWTNGILKDARRIYERAGFRLVREEKHHSFGHDLVGQFWELNF